MSQKAPKYRRQRKRVGNDLGFVEVAGRRFYFGAYGTAESRDAYRRFVLEWRAGGKQVHVKCESITVVELVARFWEHAEEYYRHPDGTPTGTAENFRTALRALKNLYGSCPAEEFGPLSLRALRENFIGSGLSRGQVNKEVQRVRQVFKFGVGRQVVPESVYAGLLAVEGLKEGRTKAREAAPVGPVPEAHIAAIENHVSRQVWALIQLQLLTAARGGELFVMRRRDLDESGVVWTYKPRTHKTAYRGHTRTIYIGPKGQEILRWFLRRSPRASMFSPREAVEEFRARRARERKTPLNEGNRAGTNRKSEPRRKPGEFYTRQSYHGAIARACKWAGVPHWHPHQLRHNAATRLREEFGLDVARVILGHRSPQVTDMYAEIDRGRAVDVMKTFG
jgi:integrase